MCNVCDWDNLSYEIAEELCKNISFGTSYLGSVYKWITREGHVTPKQLVGVRHTINARRAELSSAIPKKTVDNRPATRAKMANNDRQQGTAVRLHGEREYSYTRISPKVVRRRRLATGT